MPPQLLQRASVRWAPSPAYENTTTIIVNIGSYFLDLRIATSDDSLQRGRAGQRALKSQKPLIYQWTPMIDSHSLMDPEEATWKWENQSNTNALETGSSRSPVDGKITEYEAVWRDVTRTGPEDEAWILQSADGNCFLSLLGGTLLAMWQMAESDDTAGAFGVRWEEWDEERGWEVRFDGGNVAGVLDLGDVLKYVTATKLKFGDKVSVRGQEFVVRALESMPSLNRH